MERFGERVLGLRGERGWSRRELARRSGLHEVHLSKVETGERKRLEADTIIALAQALGVSTDYLLGLADQPARQAPRPRRKKPAPADDDKEEAA
jgi:transcriptional regulator with XRE-family HTH domain